MKSIIDQFLFKINFFQYLFQLICNQKIIIDYIATISGNQREQFYRQIFKFNYYNFETELAQLLMFDPTQFLIESSVINKCFKHEGIIGKGRDFLTFTPCTLHLFSQMVTKKKYAMQLYEGISNQFYNNKINQLAKSTHQYFIPNYSRMIFMATRKNTKNTVDLQVMYDVNELYGLSLQNIINIQIKNGDIFKESEIVQFLSEILDSLFLGGYHSFQYLQITPINIFCKIESKHKYKYFINNFGISFSGTKWQKKYYNPDDSFYKNNQKNIQNAIKSIMFSVGIIAMQMCTLQDPQKLFNENNQIDEKTLLKNLQAIKLNYSNDLFLFICSLCVLNEDKRMKLSQIYKSKNGFLLNARKIQYYEGRLDQKFKKFAGFVKENNQIENFIDAINPKLEVYRGSVINNKYEGFGVLENSSSENIFIGEFKQGQFKSGVTIKKNHSLILCQSENGRYTNCLQLMLHVYNLTSNQNILFYTGKMNEKFQREIGKTVEKDGSYYEGQFKNNKKSGKGIYFNNLKNEKMEGYWQKDLIEGKGFYIHGNKKSEVKFKNGAIESKIKSEIIDKKQQ